MISRSHCIALLATTAALANVAGASAATKAHAPVAAKRAVAAKMTAAAVKARGPIAVAPIKKAGTVVAAIIAFPTGGKGSGTEATCALWSQRLQLDQSIVDNAPEGDKDDASGPLNTDVGNAEDAGCAVIF